MSYEGYEEKLCSNGHLSHSSDIYGDFIEMEVDFELSESPLVCNFCKAPFVFTHSINETNGIELDDDGVPYPETISYPFKETGFDDIWKEDYYGNKYAVKRLKYEIPSGDKQQ